MAKKTAKSKGYRKHIEKKPYLSKRDIVLLCVLVAAIAVGAFFLFRYDDGAVKVKDGSVVTDSDNWLIVDGSSARSRARYFKLGEMGEIEGYARKAKSISTDANIPQYEFTPESEDGADITVTCTHSTATSMAEYAASLLGGVDGTEVGAIQTAALAGLEAPYFIYTTAYAESDDAEAGSSQSGGDEDEAVDESEAEPNRFTREVRGYIDAARESCVAIHIISRADAAEDCLPDEALIDLLGKAAAAVTLEIETAK